jgi:RNA polymerase sigma factor (sigma-70 family)
VEGRPLEESELVERARLGDVAAYEELVRRYQQVAFRTAYLVTSDAAEAEDAAQEAFVKAYHALGRFRAGAPFRPWLLRIVANEARNRRKAAGRRAGLALRAAEGSLSGDAAPSPEVAALEQERRATLLDAINSLREEDRQVVAYRYFLDLSEEEIASIGTQLCARGRARGGTGGAGAGRRVGRDHTRCAARGGLSGRRDVSGRLHDPATRADPVSRSGYGDSDHLSHDGRVARLRRECRG